MNYNILEKEIPCLFLYDLIGNRYKVIPVGQSTDIYVMIKAMVEEIAEYRKKCVNIEGQLEKYRKIEEYYCLYGEAGKRGREGKFKTMCKLFERYFGRCNRIRKLR